MMKRVFLIVLDSCGIGYEPDADLFGDIGANTLKRISASEKFNIPTLIKMGIGNIDGVDYLEKCDEPMATVGRLREDKIYDYKFVGLSHNTLRGAAGGAVLIAELLYREGYFN